MDGFRSESPKPWSNTTNSGVLESTDQDAPWKNFGSSLNALSFGFVATAILISMFLIMAIFEHLLRPRMALSRNAANRSLGSAPRTQMHLLEKLGHSSTVPAACPVDFSVLMPGQQTPTFIAQPAPLPCPREGVSWPCHDHELHLV
ncbi:hypothetical protein EJ110_NYTH49499 [Nymphaea thermarum]|nr:hypothetical protein EJ110_NYTH49499 [Nymphaea thermarum]